MTRRIAVRAIVLHRGKLLAVRQKPYHKLSANIPNMWNLPGGGLDVEEALVAGLEREMLEETSIKPVVGDLLYLQQFTFSDVDYLEFFFNVTNGKDYLNIDLSQTTHGPLEIEEINFVLPATTNLLPKFLMSEDIASKAQSHTPPKLFSYIDTTN